MKLSTRSRYVGLKVTCLLDWMPQQRRRGPSRGVSRDASRDLGASGRIAPWDFEQAAMSLNFGMSPMDVAAIAEKCADAETGMVDYASFAKAVLA